MTQRGSTRWSVVLGLLLTSSVASLLGWSSVESVPEQFTHLLEGAFSGGDWIRVENPLQSNDVIAKEGDLPAQLAASQLEEVDSQEDTPPDDSPLVSPAPAHSDVTPARESIYWEELSSVPIAAARVQPAQLIEWGSNAEPSWTQQDLPPLSSPSALLASAADAPLTGAPSPPETTSSARTAPAPAGQVPSQPSSTASASTANAAPKASPDPNKSRHIHEIRDWLWGIAYPVLGSGIYVGNELTLLSTERTGLTNVRFTDLQDGSIREASGQPGFGTGYRLTVGMRDDVVGFRVRYWTFCEEHVRLEHHAPEGAWPEFSVLSRLEMSAFDIELTQQHCLLGMQIETSFGGRHARYEGTDVVTGVGSFHKIMDVHGLAQSYRYLSGYGPTFSIGGRRALPWSWWGCAGGCADPLGHAMPMLEEDGKQVEFCPSHCGWSWYWNLRGSVLWADTKSSSLTDAQVIVDGGAGQQGIARSRDNAVLNRQGESGLLQGEIHLGLEYQRAIACLPACLVFRAGLEYQRWDMGRNQTESESFAQFRVGETGDLGGRVDASAFTRNRHLDLFGLNFMVGINY